MTEKEAAHILEAQKDYFLSGKTLSPGARVTALKKLDRHIRLRKEDVLKALHRDLGKSAPEAYMCEVGMVLDELGYMLHHVLQYMKERRVPTPIGNFPGTTRVQKEPYGNVLIMSPWNYPFTLTMEPLIDALAAGNTAIIKPSAYAPATAAVVEEILRAAFPREYVAVVQGGREENAFLLNMKFDHIFFTGSKAVGKVVMARAAEHLTPVTLELGGKSPCIVDSTADLKLAARRIVFGKFLNCGQTCVAPDYILCEEWIRDELVKYLQKEIRRQFGRKPLSNKNYGHMINEKHYRRVMGLLDMSKVVTGGVGRGETLQIEPTIMVDVEESDAVMQQEIFGPVLPVLTYVDTEDMLQQLKQKEQPLALYVFSRDKETIRKATQNLRYGGGCINDVLVHLASPHAPFGGVGESGMGAYHGKAGFDAFSHEKTVLERKTWADPFLRYQPYGRLRKKLLETFLK